MFRSTLPEGPLVRPREHWMWMSPDGHKTDIQKAYDHVPSFFSIRGQRVVVGWLREGEGR